MTPTNESRRRLRCVRIAPWIFLFAACSGGGDDGAPSSAAADSHRPLGAIVILLDTLRADHVGSYGYERETTPAIDALASRGALFECVASYSTWTLPGVAAVLAGDYPPLVFDSNLRMQRSLVEAIAAAGYRTAAFTEGGYVSRRWGMERGFDEFSDGPENDGVVNDAATTFRAARAWLAAHAGEPFFLFIHTYEAHMPYTHGDFTAGLDPGRVGRSYQLEFLARVRSGEVVLTASEREYIRALYDGDIRSADRHVGELLDFLAELGIAERTEVAVTSDHGEEMGEEFPRYIGGHGHSLRDNLLLVPLILADPTRDFAGKRIADQVRSIDVLPTVADLLAAEIAVPTHGKSLVPMLLGSEVGHRMAMSAENNRGAPQIAIRDGRHKLIRVLDPTGDAARAAGELAVPEFQLYDLAHDPAEDVDLTAAQPRLARRLSNRLARWFNSLAGAADATSAPDVADDELRQRLKALGYLD